MRAGVGPASLKQSRKVKTAQLNISCRGEYSSGTSCISHVAIEHLLARTFAGRNVKMTTRSAEHLVAGVDAAVSMLNNRFLSKN
jgi:hypothetical protein